MAGISHRNVAVAIVLMLGSAAPAAAASFPMPGPNEQPEPLVREAFASPYGRVLMAEFAKALRADADPACLNSKGIAPDQLAPRGEALMIKWGTRVMEIAKSFIDFQAYEKAFSGAVELNRLKQRPEIKRYLDIERPLRLAKVLDFVFEQFERYALIARIKIAPVSPMATGNAEVHRADPAPAAEEALDKLVTANRSRELKRFVTLSEQAAAALDGAIRKEEAMRAGPPRFYRGIELDLAELCIGRR